MEENRAILMSDLSGYTALTEIHGARGAANLIDKYVEIVNGSLVGDSYLHEQTGDEVMIISLSADHLLATAQNLIKNISRENFFLQVHGGMHFGSVIKHNDKYFGTAINLAARIAAKANPGRIWCSADYVNALNKTSSMFQSKGSFRFKNIREETEIFEITTGGVRHYHVDPVCKMLIHEKEKALRHPTEHLFFCGEDCLDIYHQTATKPWKELEFSV